MCVCVWGVVGEEESVLEAAWGCGGGVFGCSGRVRACGGVYQSVSEPGCPFL